MLVRTPIIIPSRHSLCFACSHKFVADDLYTSFLTENDENEGWMRQDYCTTCQPQDLTLTHWSSTVPSKEMKQELSNDRNERAYELLKEAVDEHNEEEAWVLALYLARQRLLALRQEISNEQGVRFSLYEVLATEEIIPIKKLSHQALQVEKIQAALAKKFASCGN